MHAKLKTLGADALVAVVVGIAAFVAGGFASMTALGEGPLLEPVLATPGTELPKSFTVDDKRSIEDTVRAELRALIALDAKRAFAKLTPQTQRVFGKPDKYLAAVADDLPPILAAKHFSLLGVDRSNRPFEQQVLITDSLGQEWLAKFQVERQSTGEWRVKGCVVEAAPGQLA